MRIKSYFSHSVDGAMAAARQELGGDAMLVTSRRAPSESRHLGEYEVVFGIDVPAAPHPAAPAPQNDRLSADVDKLKKALERMRQEITRAAMPPAQWLAASPEISDAYAALTRSEVDPDLARDLVQAAGRRAERTSLPHALTQEIESRFRVEPALGRGDMPPRIAAFVGPPGAGKTTTLVKLAVNYGLAARRPVTLLSVDNYRIGAEDQLRSFAAILGVGFQLAGTLIALAQAIEESRGKDLILIDTPGLGANDFESAGPLAQFLATRTDIDTQLVVPASMRATDLRRVVESFEIFRPHRLLFTRMDETGTYGAVLSEAMRTRKPLSFFTSGQHIPEDIEPASKNRLLDSILPAPAASAQTAAA